MTWPIPGAITHGTTLSATQLDATANVPGSYSYSPASGAVLPGGTQTLSVTFTPTDSTDYTTTTKSVQISVEDFSFPSPPAPVSVVPGQTATYTLSLSSEGGLTGTVNLAVSGAPSESTCTASPNTAALGANFTVTCTTTALNGYLDFPHVGQAFLIERQVTEKKTGEYSREIAYGLTSRPPQQASPQRVLQVNRGHWVIENGCLYVLDWNFDEDRSRIRVGHGPENISRLRRFAIGVIKSRRARSVAQKMRQLTRNVRLVFDYLLMTENFCACRSTN